MAEPLFSQCSFASLLVYGPYKKRANKKAGGETAGLRLWEPPLEGQGPQPPEAIIGFGGMYGKSAKSLA